MNNITNVTENELADMVASMLIKNYDLQGIQLKQNPNQIQQSQEEIKDFFCKSELEGIIEEEDERDKDLLVSFQRGETIDPKIFIGLTDVQIVNKFLSKHVMAMKVK